MGSVTPKGALDPVPHDAALLDIDQAGKLELPDAERRVEVAGPLRVRVSEDAEISVFARHSLIVAVCAVIDVQRPLGLAITKSCQANAGDRVIGPDPASDPAFAAHDSQRASKHEHGPDKPNWRVQEFRT